MTTTKSKPKVQLIGLDGNAFSIMGRVTNAMQKHYGPKTAKLLIEKYRKEAMDGSYENLLNVTMRYVDCGADEDDDE